MARLSDDALWHIRELARHYTRQGRPEGTDKLYSAVDHALLEPDRTGNRGKAYPAVYRSLAAAGLYWIKVYRYWFAYSMHGSEAVIAQIFYDQANIPGRLRK